MSLHRIIQAAALATLMFTLVGCKEGLKLVRSSSSSESLTPVEPPTAFAITGLSKASTATSLLTADGDEVLSWDAAENAEYYRVEMTRASITDCTAETSATSIDILARCPDLKDGLHYTVKLSAVNRSHVRSADSTLKITTDRAGLSNAIDWKAGIDHLITKQNVDGGLCWACPGASAANLTASFGLGMLAYYRWKNYAPALAAAVKAGDYIVNKTAGVNANGSAKVTISDYFFLQGLSHATADAKYITFGNLEVRSRLLAGTWKTGLTFAGLINEQKTASAANPMGFFWTARHWSKFANEQIPGGLATIGAATVDLVNGYVTASSSDNALLGGGFLLLDRVRGFHATAPTAGVLLPQQTNIQFGDWLAAQRLTDLGGEQMGFAAATGCVDYTNCASVQVLGPIVLALSRLDRDRYASVIKSSAVLLKRYQAVNGFVWADVAHTDVNSHYGFADSVLSYISAIDPDIESLVLDGVPAPGI